MRKTYHRSNLTTALIKSLAPAAVRVTTSRSGNTTAADFFDVQESTHQWKGPYVAFKLAASCDAYYGTLSDIKEWIRLHTK